MCGRFQTINVGKLNLEQIDDSCRQNVAGTLQLSNAKQSKVIELVVYVQISLTQI